MIDTFALRIISSKEPDLKLLRNNNFVTEYHKYTGKPRKYFYNMSNNEPTIDIYLTKDAVWIVKVLATPANWIKGSNLYLPLDSEIPDILDLLSYFVTGKTGYDFDAHTAIVTRVDFTKDYYVGTQNIHPIISNFRSASSNKYEVKPYKETTVYFNNKSKVRDKTIKIYSKEHKVETKTNDVLDKFAAKGLIRLEVMLKNAKVRYLIDKFKLSDRQAKTILNNELSNRFLDSVKKEIEFEDRMKYQKPKLERIFEGKTVPRALTLLGYRYAQKSLGQEFYKKPSLKITPKTIKSYEKDCTESGLFSLE